MIFFIRDLAYASSSGRAFVLLVYLKVIACERVNAWAILLYTSDLSGFWSHMINLYKYISHFLSGISQITSATCHVRKKMQNLQLNPPRAWPIKSGWNISLLRSKAVAIASCVSVLNLGIKCTCRDDSKEIFIVSLVSLLFCAAECLIYKEVKLLNVFFLQRIIIVGLKFTYKINSPRFVGVN